MNAIDWVAIIGAAAWAPQIFTWLYQFITKPKITLYLHTKPEIGYTSLGPIFNVSLALLSEKKGIALNNFSVSIRHESGASYTFDWDGLSEDLSEIQNPLGQPTAIRKTYLPLVVRVLPLGVAQIFVRYQYRPFKERFGQNLQAAQNKLQLLRNAGRLRTEQDIDALASEQEFSDIVRLINSEFIWVAGRYTAVFDFQSPSRFKYKKDECAFSLSQDDIDELRKNIDNIKLNTMQTAKTIVLQDYKAKEIPWKWRYPELRKMNE